MASPGVTPVEVTNAAEQAAVAEGSGRCANTLWNGGLSTAWPHPQIPPTIALGWFTSSKFRKSSGRIHTKIKYL
jgi:hypothetical protein